MDANRESKDVCRRARDGMQVKSRVVTCRCTCNRCAAVEVFRDQTVAVYSFETCAVFVLEVRQQSAETVPCIPHIHTIEV